MMWMRDLELVKLVRWNIFSLGYYWCHNTNKSFDLLPQFQQEGYVRFGGGDAGEKETILINYNYKKN